MPDNREFHQGRKRPSTRIMVCVVFAALAAALALGCGSSSSSSGGGGGSSSSSGGNGTITVAIDAGVTSIDPAFACTAFYDYSIVANLYDTVVTYGEKTEANGEREIIPKLAESWDLDSSKTEYTLHMRKDVKFPSGNPLAAEDVVYGYERDLDKGGCQQYVMTLGEPDLIKSIKAVGEHTVKIKLSRPNPLFLGQLAQPGVVPIDKKLVEEHGGMSKAGDQWLAQHSAGVGAYEISEYQPDSRVTLDAVPTYWQGEAKTKRAIFRIVTDPTTLETLTRSGDIDMAYGVPLKDVESLKSSGLKVIANKISFFIIFGLNNKRAPTDNVKVRQAINLALPLQEMTEALGHGYAESFSGPIPPAMPYYPNLPLPEQDVAKAKKLLAEAGVEANFSIDVIAGKSLQAEVATIIQNSLSEIGINVEISTLGSAAFFDRVGTFKSDAYLILDGPTLNDPGYFLGFEVRCGDPFNWTQYCNKKVDALLQEGLTQFDPDTRARVYKEASEIVAEESPFVPIFAPDQVIITDPSLKGYVQYPAGELILWPISVGS